MADEIKKPGEAQAPAQQTPEVKAEPVVKVEEAAKPVPTGLDSLTAEQLEKLYDKSPDLFKKVQEKVSAKAPEGDKGQPAQKPQSAAPVVYEGQEIKLPEDVQVDAERVKSYLAHAKEIGLSPKQVQGEIEFQVKQAREALQRQQQPTPQEQDATNVAKLKGDKEFGLKYEENMEIARRAASKFAGPEMVERLKTSDPVLVRHFWKIGLKDADDQTPGAPNRNGNESGDEAGEGGEQAQQEYLQKRYPNTPEMFQKPIRG